jgi:hypothetical protein
MITDNPHDKALRWSRRLNFVYRWNVTPTIRRQSVAEHCFHVARTAMWLLERTTIDVPDNLRLAILGYALTHDDNEAVNGDTPSPIKAPRNPSEMSVVEIVVKIADILEALAFIHEEAALGNRHGVLHSKLYLQGILAHYWSGFPWLEDMHRLEAADLAEEYLQHIVPSWNNSGPAHPVLEGRNDF